MDSLSDALKWNESTKSVEFLSAAFAFLISAPEGILALHTDAQPIYFITRGAPDVWSLGFETIEHSLQFLIWQELFLHIFN